MRLTYKSFPCTCFNFLFINWNKCGAITGISKKYTSNTIHFILHIKVNGYVWDLPSSSRFIDLRCSVLECPDGYLFSHF